MTNKPARKRYDWSRAKMAHCGCGSFGLTIIFDDSPHCATCIDVLYTTALENYINEQAARIEELEKELAALRSQEPVAWRHNNGPFGKVATCSIKAACCWEQEGFNVSPLYEQPVPSAPAAVPDDLVMQIRRLVHALKNAKPDHNLVKSVPDYMRRKGYWKVTDCLRDGGRFEE